MVAAHQLDGSIVSNDPMPGLGLDHEAFSQFVDELNCRLYFAHNHGNHPSGTITSDDRLYYPGGTELLLIDVDFDPDLRSTYARICYERSVWTNLDRLSARTPDGNLQTLIEDMRRYSSRDIDDVYVRDWLTQSGYVDNGTAPSLSWRSACYGLWRLGILASDVIGLTGIIGQIDG